MRIWLRHFGQVLMTTMLRLWRMSATRREWSRRQAMMHLVFAIGDPEVNNDSDKFYRVIFLENFLELCRKRALVQETICHLRVALVVDDRLFGNFLRNIDVN